MSEEWRGHDNPANLEKKFKWRGKFATELSGPFIILHCVIVNQIST